MRKMQFWMIISFVAWAGIIYYVVTTLVDGVAKEKAKYEVNMGKQVVIGGDSLQIVDYSTLDETYTLSNGVKVSKKIAE